MTPTVQVAGAVLALASASAVVEWAAGSWPATLTVIAGCAAVVIRLIAVDQRHARTEQTHRRRMDALKRSCEGSTMREGQR